MKSSPPAYLVHAASQRRPTVWLNTQPPGYFSDRFNLQDFGSAWPPTIREVRGLSYALPDAMIWTGPGPLVSARAVDLLQAIAPNCAEYVFFASIKGKGYFAVNVPCGSDVLDEGRSLVNRSSSGAIVSIRRHAFMPDACFPALFKLPGRLDGDLYCTPAAAVAISKSGLKGFSFWNPLEQHLRDLFLGKDVSCAPSLGA